MSGAEQAGGWWAKLERAIGTLATVATLFVVVFTWVSITQVRDEQSIAREGQITDRYNAAVENLGNGSLDVRLGGIYALQRIMQDSRRDQPTVISVLSAYIRSHAHRHKDTKGAPSGPDSDVQAALSVLLSRDVTRDRSVVVNLSGADLHGADLRGEGLVAANLSATNLSDANLSRANLRKADLRKADLSQANLGQVDFEQADLKGAALLKADLGKADLVRADLGGASLNGANLGGANLRGAEMTTTNLRAADLYGTDLTAANLVDANLHGADLGKSYMRDAHFEGADLTTPNEMSLGER